MQEMIDNTAKYQAFSHAELLTLVQKLEQENFHFKYLLFSKKKERYIDTTGMRELFNEAEEAAAIEADTADADDTEVEVGPHQRKKRGKRQPLPKNLPREREEFDLPENEKFCAIHGITKVRIGEEVSEQLVVIPAKLKVKELVTFTYKCPCCVDGGEGVGIVKSQKDPQPIPKSIASPELLAFIATSKYEDALPLYRQEKIFARYNIEISRTSMARWMIEASELARPLINLMHECMLAAPVLHCDETPVQVLKEEGRSAEQKSYMWALAQRHENQIILFSYFDNRGKKAAKDLLCGFTGTLVTDGLKTYDATAREYTFKQAGCMAHLRRKFFHAEKEEKRLIKAKTKPTASTALSFIRRLYLIERELQGQPPDKIKERRQKDSLPILATFHAWITEQQGLALPQSLLGKAVSYALDQWSKLLRFCEDGLIPIDNNYIEAHIRPFVIGRNNWTFSVTPAGANASAVLYSLVETAKVNGLNPYDYLRLIFKELPKAKELDDFEKLLPYNICKHFHVMPYRTETNLSH